MNSQSFCLHQVRLHLAVNGPVAIFYGSGGGFLVAKIHFSGLAFSMVNGTQSQFLQQQTFVRELMTASAQMSMGRWRGRECWLELSENLN